MYFAEAKIGGLVQFQPHVLGNCRSLGMIVEKNHIRAILVMVYWFDLKRTTKCYLADLREISS